MRLDAEHDPNGKFSAFLDGIKDVWVCAPYESDAPFMGLRRRDHTCPDTQLSL